MAHRSYWLLGLLMAGLMLTSGCGSPNAQSAAPPRADDPIIFSAEPSVVGIDMEIDLAELERDLEQGIPRQLWQITRKDMICVPPKKVDLALFKVKTPKIKCDIDGEVNRGRLRIIGRGRDLTIAIPIKAVVVARDIGGVLKQETGTAAADLTLGLRLDLASDWRLKGDVALDYAWSTEPGIDFMGQRINFTKDADREIAGLRRRIEAGLERALAGVRVRPAAERGWQTAHAVVELNRENPPVWGRITPEHFQYGGYRVDGKRLYITLGLVAALETHVGEKPEANVPTPLPPVEPLAVKPGFAVLNVPVVADYAVLEPVIAKALAKRAAEPFLLGEYGKVTASFADIDVYGTTDNRIAVGITFDAKSDLSIWPEARGRLWLTARPVNAPNSREVGFAEVAVAGDTDMMGQGLLLALANSEDIGKTIAEALQQNFERDFAELSDKIARAVSSRQDGPLVYAVTLERIDTGRIRAFGQGLHLPVELHARIEAKLIKPD